MNGVRFDNIHSYTDLGLTLSSFVISPPSPKTYKVNIPGMDGSIDLTEDLTGDIKYENRTIKMEFGMIGDWRTVQDKYSQVMNALHGKKFSEIVFDDDGNYYYVGRVSAIDLGTDPLIGTITLQCVVDPYKYDWGDDWLWDDFSFEIGIINEMNNLQIDGVLDVTFIGKRKKYIPYIETDTDMKVQYKGKEYNLAAGKNKIFDIEFSEGENVLKFIGSGTVTVENIGGSL